MKDHPTVYEMLEFEERDNVTANVLIDQRRIETILLLRTREMGSYIVEKNSEMSKCCEAYLINGDYIVNKGSFRAYASRTSSAKFFVGNIEESIK